MAKGDIQPLESATGFSNGGGISYMVASGTVGSINAGEPVQKLAGAAGVTPLLTNSPTTTNRIVGVATSQSNETASAAGTVTVIPCNDSQIWMIAPKVASSWNTQALYNANVGKRVLIDLTSSVYTALAVDGASNGCIVEYLDISKYPGMVAFSFSPLCDYRNV